MCRAPTGEWPLASQGLWPGPGTPFRKAAWLGVEVDTRTKQRSRRSSCSCLLLPCPGAKKGGILSACQGNPNTHWTSDRLVQGPGQWSTVGLQGLCVPGARIIPAKRLRV